MHSKTVLLLCLVLAVCSGCRTTSTIDADAFFRENATKPGVRTMPSGLQVVVHKQGQGPVPDVTDQVTVHYEGRLLTGEVFESSYDNGGPVSMPVLKSISGWVEALKRMPEGSEWTLYVPSDLAYGKRGVSSNDLVGPNTPLIFKLKLMKVHRSE